MARQRGDPGQQALKGHRLGRDIGHGNPVPFGSHGQAGQAGVDGGAEGNLVGHQGDRRRSRNEIVRNPHQTITEEQQPAVLEVLQGWLPGLAGGDRRMQKGGDANVGVGLAQHRFKMVDRLGGGVAGQDGQRAGVAQRKIGRLQRQIQQNLVTGRPRLLDLCIKITGIGAEREADFRGQLGDGGGGGILGQPETGHHDGYLSGLGFGGKRPGIGGPRLVPAGDDGQGAVGCVAQHFRPRCGRQGRPVVARRQLGEGRLRWWVPGGRHLRIAARRRWWWGGFCFGRRLRFAARCGGRCGGRRFPAGDGRCRKPDIGGGLGRGRQVGVGRRLAVGCFFLGRLVRGRLARGRLVCGCLVCGCLRRCRQPDLGGGLGFNRRLG